MGTNPTVVEICTGAGGQALGLEGASFDFVAAVEIEKIFCQTLWLNRPGWNVINRDVKTFDGTRYAGADLLAGGVPCPPFSVAGKQLGVDDERNLFPEAIRLAEEINPKAVMLENVAGFASNKFLSYRENLIKQLNKLGYITDWKVLNASDYGVPQLRPRFILVGLKKEYADNFRWPEPAFNPPTVGKTLLDLMSRNGWAGAADWSKRANRIAPTLVGGSTKHGGPDLGPTRARSQWAELGVDGKGLVDEPPAKDFPSNGLPRLTVRMAARIQGFPDSWKFVGKKTSAYRQVGNAFPPPVARAVGVAINRALGRAPYTPEAAIEKQKQAVAI